jgi:hypothetical protein
MTAPLRRCAAASEGGPVFRPRCRTGPSGNRLASELLWRRSDPSLVGQGHSWCGSLMTPTRRLTPNASEGGTVETRRHPPSQALRRPRDVPLLTSRLNPGRGSGSPPNCRPPGLTFPATRRPTARDINVSSHRVTHYCSARCLYSRRPKKGLGNTYRWCGASSLPVAVNTGRMDRPTGDGLRWIRRRSRQCPRLPSGP